MALHVSPEKKKEGEDTFVRTVGQNRRQFLKTALAAGAAVPLGAAMYFGYKKLEGNPVKVALIGAGDEGGVLVGAHNPEYLQFVAVADIRPSNMQRIFAGEATGPRLGFNKIYGKAAEKIRKYDDYKKLLSEEKEIEAVVIALPLNLHAQAAMDAMDAGKHVLCEKLMAWNVLQCKQMIRKARKKDLILTIGHQRHYSLLYQHALDVIKANPSPLGTVKHIRALWHRNNSWPMPPGPDGKRIKDKVTGADMLLDSWRKLVPPEDYEKLKDTIKDYGFDTVEHLVRWRLFKRYGGGLMAELGSHQLDACSIFLGKKHPLAVSGVGGKFFYEDEREVEDHVFTTFEFPGLNYGKGKLGKNDVVVVTYSSISTNEFEPYGECVMGTHGTMVVEQEQRAALYPERDKSKKAPPKGMTMAVTTAAAGKPVTDSSGSTGYEDPAADRADGQKVIGPGPVSRGYREEMEDFAYCIRMHSQAKGDAKARELWREGPPGAPGEPRGPRCHGLVAMADAIVALTSNIAMATSKRIPFEDKWFKLSEDPSKDKDEVPEVKLKGMKVSDT